MKFRLPHGVVEPYSVAPWAEEKPADKIPHLLRLLRGDFLCAPFGGSESAYRGEQHPPHGETANAAWTFESLEKDAARTTLHLSLRTKIRPGRVEKFIGLRRGETALYCRHVFSGFSGRMNLGHHATLKFSDAPGAHEQGLVATSPIAFAQVLPVPFEKPEEGGYSSLKPGAAFTRLDQVPAADGTTADLSRYPARRGFEDLVMITHEAAPDFAWTAVTFPAQRYVWFALKDPRVLRSTVLWHSNGGRHYAPWSGRHTGVLGLEDVTSLFSSWARGIGAGEPGEPSRHRDVPHARPEAAVGGELHHGRRGGPARLGRREGDCARAGRDRAAVREGPRRARGGGCGVFAVAVAAVCDPPPSRGARRLPLHRSRLRKAVDSRRGIFAFPPRSYERGYESGLLPSR